MSTNTDTDSERLRSDIDVERNEFAKVIKDLQVSASADRISIKRLEEITVELMQHIQVLRDELKKNIKDVKTAALLAVEASNNVSKVEKRLSDVDKRFASITEDLAGITTLINEQE